MNFARASRAAGAYAAGRQGNFRMKLLYMKNRKVSRTKQGTRIQTDQSI
jgi:hypothetical protein